MWSAGPYYLTPFNFFSAFPMVIISFIAQFGLFILQINYISFISSSRLGNAVEEKLERNQRPWLCELQRLVWVYLGHGSFFQGSLGYDYALCQPQLPNINWLCHFWTVV